MASHQTACGIITLLTDFGTSDGYVAAMKGTALTLSSALRVIDITHEVPSQDIFRAALILKQVAQTFPKGTVHVVVVDPGVGTHRLPIAVESADQYFVGPDNGVLTLAATPPRQAYQLTNSDLMRAKLSDTFHGRDIFAPVGARLACDTSIEEVGPALDTIAEIPLPTPTLGQGTIVGEVIYADRYGNLMINVTEDLLRKLDPASIRITISGITIEGLRSTYGDVKRGELVAYVGSTGYLEVARREGNARHYLGAPRGAQVILNHG
ncbi:MAG: SAM-dependent chlorinase/fluorinase [bacterium]